MKKLSIVFLVLVVVVVGLLLFKDVIIKASVQKGVELVTGLKLDIESFKIGILKPFADIKNLTLLNPKNFPDKVMLDMPEIYVDYNFGAILKGKLHFPEVRLALKEFVVIKNAQGELNLNAFKNIQAQAGGASATKETSVKVPNIQIDLLKLSIGKVIYKDYSKSSQPEIREFKINLNETYTNINNPNALANLIISRALTNTTVASLANFDLKGLQGTVNTTLSGVQKTVITAVSGVQETGKQAVDAVKGILTSPFDARK